jgi:hypothetical protein
MNPRYLLSAFIALTGLTPVHAQAPSTSVLPKLIEHDVWPCEQAMLDARKVLLSVPGYHSDKPFAGFLKEARDYSCRYFAVYRLFNDNSSEKPPVPKASTGGYSPTCPDGWILTRPTQLYACAPDLHGGTPRFVVRAVSKDKIETWADQKTCPAIVPALQELERVVAPKFTGNGPSPRVLQLTTDGTLYMLWAAGEVYPIPSGDNELTIHLRGKEGSPLGRWMDETTAAISNCFTSELPKP